jgi:hypothetical protein
VNTHYRVVPVRAAAFLLALLILCLATAGAQDPRVSPAKRDTFPPVALPPAFPRGQYTPFGYIDNPYHSMVFNRSGVIRSVPPLGFGWWRTDFEGNYGGGPRDHVNYSSFLQMSVRVGSDLFMEAGDFAGRGIELSSAYHSKQLISFDWRDSSVSISLKYFLPREHTLSCLVELSNAGSEPRAVTIYATNTYGIGDTRWWGSDGLTARVVPEAHAMVSKIWAYGDVFALGSTLGSVTQFCTDSELEWEKRIRTDDTTSVRSLSIRGRGPIRAMQSYTVQILPGSTKSILFCLSRGKNEAEALGELKRGLDCSLDDLKRQLDEDQQFWSGCPLLAGEWPETWKRGWVYDFETLRMNVRRPLGMFKHPWDGMQIHSPRVVLGETSLDMMTLAYADPALARDVILGTFVDARQPNIPCAREDGSVNMISSDGSECGTAPMWGYPFHVIDALYRSTGDAAWIAQLYPRLKAYIDWWLTHRTDGEGWLHCNNSWESGQDGSKRFIVAEGNEGAVADFVRTVDVEASMAEAMEIMADFAVVAGRAGDRQEWRRLAERRVSNVRAMFVEGWFRDFDGRTNRPIMLQNPYDVMMLAPLACSVATREQLQALLPKFGDFQRSMAPWLQWPPGMQTFVEAAWNAGARQPAADVVAGTAERIYQRTDARTILFGDPRDPFGARIPGVADEFWPNANVRAGGEAYGWGATLPMHILRAIVGFREGSLPPRTEFYLAPSIPAGMDVAGKTYIVRNLRYRDVAFDVTYRCKGPGVIGIALDYRSDAPVAMTIMEDGKNEMKSRTGRATRGTISIDGVNGGVYVVTCER